MSTDLPGYRPKLAVVARLYLQYRYANLIQTLQMTEALGKLTPTTLFADRNRRDYRSGRQTFPSVLNELGVAENMQFVHFHNPLYFVAGTENIRKSFFVKRALSHLHSKQFQAVFTRFIEFGIAASHFYPTVLEIHDITNIPDVNKLREALKNGDLRLLCISENLRQLLIDRGMPQEYLFTVHDGVNLEKFQKEGIEPLFRSSQKVVGYAGHLYSDRGIEMIIKAAEDNPNLDFHLAGGLPDDLQHYRNIVDHHSITNVTLHGNLPHRQIPSFLKACDYLVMPYSRSLKTFDSCSPLKVFEYMAAGKVILTSNLPTIREVLSARNALIFEADDQSGFQQLLSRLQQGDVDEEKLRRNALADVRQYSWDSRAGQVLTALEKIVRDNRKTHFQHLPHNAISG